MHLLHLGEAGEEAKARPRVISSNWRMRMVAWAVKLASRGSGISGGT